MRRNILIHACLILAVSLPHSTLHAGGAEETASVKPKSKGPPFFRSGAGEAEQLATKLREMMLTYDAAVESKASTEERFYLDQQDTLRNLWLPGRIPIEDKGTTESDVKAWIKESIPYLAITISARRAAREMAESLAVDPVSATPVQNLLGYLDTGVKQDQGIFAKAQSEQQRLRLDLGESLAKIDLQDSLRKDIRDSMLKLELAPSLSEKLTQVFKLGQAAEKQFSEKPSEKKAVP